MCCIICHHVSPNGREKQQKNGQKREKNAAENGLTERKVENQKLNVQTVRIALKKEQ